MRIYSLKTLSLHLQEENNMEITFEEDYLRELYYEGKTHNKKYRFQPQIIKKYIRVIDFMESLNCKKISIVTKPYITKLLLATRKTVNL